jgi:hypothetical protein
MESVVGTMEKQIPEIRTNMSNTNTNTASYRYDAWCGMAGVKIHRDGAVDNSLNDEESGPGVRILDGSLDSHRWNMYIKYLT